MNSRHVCKYSIFCCLKINKTVSAATIWRSLQVRTGHSCRSLSLSFFFFYHRHFSSIVISLSLHLHLSFSSSSHRGPSHSVWSLPSPCADSQLKGRRVSWHDTHSCKRTCRSPAMGERREDADQYRTPVGAEGFLGGCGGLVIFFTDIQLHQSESCGAPQIFINPPPPFSCSQLGPRRRQRTASGPFHVESYLP